MHSVSDLTTSSRKTTGDVPPKLVGASTTVVGNKMYLFGGRLVTERRMVADLYMFDLETFVWQKIVPNPDDDVPGARYFHSTDTWRNHLVIFGGMGHKADTTVTDDLCVLNDVRFFDLASKRWLSVDQVPPSTSSEQQPSSLFVPRARYAHLSSVTGNRLFIIGGQDLNNLWLDDVCVFDLESRAWVHRREYRRHSGTYRSVAVSANMRTRFPAEETKSSAQKSTSLGPPGGRYKVDKRPSSAKGEYTSSDKLVHLPYSTEPSDEFPNDIYLYSNYNFTDVQRELEIFKPVQGGEEFQLEERSSSMTGTVLPPGLRFPTGAICGTHLIFAGTYLAHSYQSYSIWALDLKTMAWSRLDPGSALSTGSWFRACLWSVPGNSKFLIFGNRAGNLVEDYNRRLLSWDDVAVIDLEAFGIYQAPTLTLDLRSQELGLAALEEELFADFEVVCDDGRKIGCSRKILESRWPWFKDQRKLFVDNASRALESIPPANGDVPIVPDPTADARPAGEEPRLDPRLSPRSLVLSEPYPITLALLQYFYSLALLTPLQHAPAVLSQLMLLSATYNLPHLQLLVKHAMHRALTPATSVGVYEVATLCSCQSLQIRALKSVMASSRRSAGRSRGNSNGPGGDKGPEGSSGNHGAARPRGMSDLRGMTRGSETTNGGTAKHNGAVVNGRSHAVSSAAPTSVSPGTSHAGHGGSVSSIGSAKAIPPHLRHKHAVNLSMDSLYQALKSADAANATVEVDTTGSVLDHGMSDEGADTNMGSAPSVTENERSVKRVASPPSLSTMPPSSFVTPTSGPSISRAQSASALHNGEVPTPTQTQWSGQSEIETGPPNGLQRTESLASSSLSHEAGLLPPRTSSRMGVTQMSRSASPMHQGDISDTPSLSSSLQTSRSLSSPSTPSGGRAQSPITPESPMLITPQDTFGSVLSSLSSPGVSQAAVAPSSFVTLGPIDENDLMEGQLDDSRSATPNQVSNVIAVQVHPPPGKAQQQIEEEPPQIRRERSASWNDLKAAFTTSKRRLSPHSATPESLSPTTATFPGNVGSPTEATTNGASTEDTATKTLFGRSRAESQPVKVGSGGGIFLARSIFSSKGSKAEREDAKARAKAEKAAGQDRATTPSTPTSPSLPWTPSMEDGQLNSKAIKALEKNKRKEEQKRKLEQLAEQLKAGNKKGQDGLSFASSSSGEQQRKTANHWIEETDGMYGGSINSWGGL